MVFIKKCFRTCLQPDNNGTRWKCIIAWSRPSILWSTTSPSLKFGITGLRWEHQTMKHKIMNIVQLLFISERRWASLSVVAAIYPPSIKPLQPYWEVTPNITKRTCCDDCRFNQVSIKKLWILKLTTIIHALFPATNSNNTWEVLQLISGIISYTGYQ